MKIKETFLSGLILTVMIPIWLGALHVAGNKPEKATHGTVILIQNLTHLFKFLVFLALVCILGLIFWIQ